MLPIARWDVFVYLALLDPMDATTTNPPNLSPAMLTDVLYKTTGALFMAAFFSTTLYGLMLHQAYRYFRLYPKDTLFIQSIVFAVLLIETALTICNIHYCYYDFVIHYASLVPFQKIVWSGNLLPLLGILTSSTTHIFFIRRVSMIGFRYKWLAIFAILFHVVQTSFALAITVQGFVKATPDVYTDQKWMIGLCFGFAVLADITITGPLLVVMYEGRKIYQRNLQKSIIDVITFYFINTGALVFLFDVVTLILAMATSQNLYWAAINLITSRVYTNTLFSVLNSRKLQVAHGIEIFSDGPPTTISRATRLAALERFNVPQVPDTTPTKISINVQTEREDENMSRVGLESQAGSVDMAKTSRM
ncbi:hypothetical protein C8Q76DRAFT_700452 [Earliella scabrosa]|nr:hypothetical protein C8Q76DRAFT_700452 [Earliella scabrosa]